MVQSTFPRYVACPVDFNKFKFNLRICRNAYIIEPRRINANRRSIVKQRTYCLRRIPRTKLGNIAYNIYIYAIFGCCVIDFKPHGYLRISQYFKSAKRIACNA